MSAVQLSVDQVVRDYDTSRRHLLVLGYNATLTTAVEAPRQPIRHFDQIKVVPVPMSTFARVFAIASFCLACLQPVCLQGIDCKYPGSKSSDTYAFCSQLGYWPPIPWPCWKADCCHCWGSLLVIVQNTSDTAQGCSTGHAQSQMLYYSARQAFLK